MQANPAVIDLANTLSKNLLEKACQEIDEQFNTKGYSTKNPALLSSYLNSKTHLLTTLIQVEKTKIKN